MSHLSSIPPTSCRYDGLYDAHPLSITYIIEFQSISEKFIMGAILKRLYSIFGVFTCITRPSPISSRFSVYSRSFYGAQNAGLTPRAGKNNFCSCEQVMVAGHQGPNPSSPLRGGRTGSGGVARHRACRCVSPGRQLFRAVLRYLRHKVWHMFAGVYVQQTN